MNNNLCIIFAIEGNQLLMYIPRVSDNACSAPNSLPENPRHHSEFVCISHVDSVTLPGLQNVFFGALMYSETYHNYSPGIPVLVIKDPSYSEGQPECPPRVLYFAEIDTSKFTLHILLDTAGGFERPKFILLM